MKTNIKLKAGYIAILIFVAHCADGQVLTLDSVLRAVKERNPILKVYGQRSEAMTAYAQGAKNWSAPEVGGGLWMLPYRATDVPQNKGQIMMSVQQKFTSGAKLRANQGYLDSKAAIESAGAGVVFNELKAEAKTAYYQWIVLEKKKRVLAENEAIINLLLKVSRLRYPYNQAKLGNIYKAEARLAEVQNLILANESEVAQKNKTLNQLMNLHADYRFSVDTTIQLLLPATVDTVSLAESRSDVKRIDRSIQSMILNQSLERNQAKPDFTISFNQMFARGAGMPNQFMLLGMVSIPIAPWSSRMYKANVNGMGKEIDALKSERASLLNELRGTASREATEATSLQRQLGNYELRILPALKKNYQTLMIAYEENREELPVVIDAWDALNAAQLQHLDTLQKFYETIVSYEKTLEKE